MDIEHQKIQFLGFFGILKEAFKIITLHRKIFSQITLSVILPLSFIYFAQIEFSEFFSGEITINKNDLDNTQMGSQKYSKTSDILSTEWTTFWLYKIAFSICSIILSILSTSAVVYTVACIYTAKEITYTEVMKVVPRVWKRLMITFIWNFSIIFALTMSVALIVILWFFTLGSSATGITVAIILFLISLSLVVYTSFVWQLANVISVLEDVSGIQAMRKSKNLIKGNTGVCAAIFLVENLCFVVIALGFQASVVDGAKVWVKIFHVCLWSILWSMLLLFVLVVQTIICKSYHHENIDKLSLANHLEVYALLDSKDVQLEHSEV